MLGEMSHSWNGRSLPRGESAKPAGREVKLVLPTPYLPMCGHTMVLTTSVPYRTSLYRRDTPQAGQMCRQDPELLVKYCKLGVHRSPLLCGGSHPGCPNAYFLRMGSAGFDLLRFSSTKTPLTRLAAERRALKVPSQPYSQQHTGQAEHFQCRR